MRILIDATTAQEGGGITYLRNILTGLIRHGQGHDFDVLLSSVFQGEIIDELPQGINGVTRGVPRNPLARWIYLQLFLPRLLRAGKYDLLFSIADVSSAYAPCPRVILVTNESLYAPLKSFPQFSQRVQHFRYRLPRQPLAYLTARGANRVIFVSEASRANVEKKMPVCHDRTRVIHHGLNPHFSSASQEGSPESGLETRPYLLTVTSLSQHKNLETLLRGFAQVIGTGEHQDLQLLIVGPSIQASVDHFLKAEVVRLGIADRVHFIGRVANENLAQIYRKAKAFVLTSRFETFALPLVEAMACGVPIVATDLPVCREVCQEAARYFTTENDEELASQILNILGDGAIAEKMSYAGLKQAENFSLSPLVVGVVS
jgi:glycosyltransferase involved in cell wall biosynthesis